MSLDLGGQAVGILQAGDSVVTKMAVMHSFHTNLFVPSPVNDKLHFYSYQLSLLLT